MVFCAIMSFVNVSRSIAVLVGVALVAACGTGDPTNSAANASPSQPVLVSDRVAPVEGSSLAGSAITEFGAELFAEARSSDPQSNLTLSPASVAIALAMVEPGTVNEAQQQIRRVLRVDDPAAFHSSMNALEQDLETRPPGDYGEDNDPGELIVAVANAAYLQEGYPFEAEYLDTIGSNYGPVLSQVDFSSDPDGVASQINDFVAQATNDQIVDLIGDGVIQPETVLALVNALYLKVSWLDTFDSTSTTEVPFTLFDGSNVDVDMMNGRSNSSTQGDGWVAARKNYVGDLSAEFILPDDGRFDEVAANLSMVFTDIEQNRVSGAELAVPRFETRSSIELTPTLNAMGLTAPFRGGGLLGIANDSNLVIDQVIHEAFVAMDEEGTEAAAATVVLFTTVSGSIDEPVDVILDRPFIYRIIDNVSGATLFIGQIANPTQ